MPASFTWSRRALFGAALLLPTLAFAQQAIGPSPAIPLPRLDLSVGGGEGNFVETLRVMGLLTILSLAPAIIISVTSFTRIVIVFGFLRTALGTQSSPPNQVVVSLALFLTAAIMTPVGHTIWNKGYVPHQAGQITDAALLDISVTELSTFMLKHTRDKELGTVFNLAQLDRPARRLDTPFHLLVPAFMLSELKIAFQIGFLVAIPFLVIDLVVATLLMAMGMMMLPPVMVSLPFKVLVFLLADGWNLIVINLARSFGLEV